MQNLPTDTYTAFIKWGDIGDWDVSGVGDFSYAFSKHRDQTGGTYKENGNLKAAEFVGTGMSKWITTSVTTLESTFNNAAKMNSDLSGWKVDGVTTLGQTFKSASKFIGTRLDLWITASATSLSGTFYNAAEMNSDLSGWKVDKVTTLYQTFRGASNFIGTGLGLGSWITTKVTTLQQTFTFAFNFVGTGLGKWITASVTTMDSTFKQAYKMNADLSGWQTAKATTLRHMFHKAYKFNSDISSWETSRVVGAGFGSMFEYTRAFNSNLQKWDVAKANTITYIFRKATAFEGDGIAAWADVVVNSYSANHESANPWWNVFDGATKITPCNKKRIFDAWTKGNVVAANPTSVTEATCLELAVALFGSKVTATKQTLQTGTWGYVPSGCSVHSAGDWAAYYTTSAPTLSTEDYTNVAVPPPMDVWVNGVCDPVRHTFICPEGRDPHPTHATFHVPHTLRRRVANRMRIMLC